MYKQKHILVIDDDKKLGNLLKSFLTEKGYLVDFVENPYPFIRETEILILSSKYEGLPNVLLEAQLLKKFIIIIEIISIINFPKNIYILI